MANLNDPSEFSGHPCDIVFLAVFSLFFLVFLSIRRVSQSQNTKDTFLTPPQKMSHGILRSGFQISKFARFSNFGVFRVFYSFLRPLDRHVPKKCIFFVMGLRHLSKRVSIKLATLEICSRRKLPQEKMIKITK